MGKQEEALKVAEELLTDIEGERLKPSEVTLKASRLARLLGHEALLTFLAYERSGYPTDGSANEWIGRAGRWSDTDEGKFFPYPLSKMEARADADREALRTLQGGGNYSGEWASIAGREHDQKIAVHPGSLARNSGICRQVVATVYEIVVEIYHELLFSQLQATLFAETQARVDGALGEASGSALDKIESVSERLRDGAPESVSQALTTCRRLIDSCADHLFAPRAESYALGEGVTLKVGPQNVLNRLQAHVHATEVSKSRRDRLRRTCADLYERCSAGTHADVSVQEARFIFLQTYTVLGEILTLSPPPPMQHSTS